MIEEYEQQKRKQISRTRSLMDYVMGALLFLIGIYFLVYQKMGVNVFDREPSSIDYVIGGLFVLYGAWRIYRGYKKDYFKG